MKKLFLCLNLLFSLNTFAQDLVASKQYFLHPFLLNPAIAGTTNCTELSIGHQQQWFGIQDAPSTQVLSFQSRMDDVGLGACLVSDRNGYTQNYLAQAVFAYHINFSNHKLENVLSLGFATSLASHTIDETQFVQHRLDPAITGTKVSESFPDVNFGAFYLYKSFTAGISVKQLMSQKLEGVHEPFRPTYTFAQVAYNFKLDKQMNILPSLVYISGNDWGKEIDLNCKFFYLNESNFRFWVGESYHYNLIPQTSKNIDIQIATGFSWNNYLLAYAFETVGTGLISNGFGSHQLMFGINFCSSKKKKCPAYE